MSLREALKPDVVFIRRTAPSARLHSPTITVEGPNAAPGGKHSLLRWRQVTQAPHHRSSTFD